MKRDWECIRAILVALEEKEGALTPLPADQVPGFNSETASYHMKMMIEAGLIEGDCKRGRVLHCIAICMTWQGHELLDKIKSEKIWSRVKAAALQQAVPLSGHLVTLLSTKALEALF